MNGWSPLSYNVPMFSYSYTRVVNINGKNDDFFRFPKNQKSLSPLPT